MKTSIHAESDLDDFPDKLPADRVLIHFKMIGVGPNTLKKANYTGSEICKIVRKEPGFFLMSQGGSGLRGAMHDLVDRFCDIQEGVKK